ncbi:hypothetical protein NX059_003634 [Plenodomus lindquistii]|nr:hypothetical protein NX059_003634 [Plenodomus lindquistii]
MASTSTPKIAADKSITAANASESPLLRLPAELRNAIYGYMFGDAYFIVGFQNHTTTIVYRNKQYLALLYVCRQTYTETALLPFKLNTWVFHTNLRHRASRY